MLESLIRTQEKGLSSLIKKTDFMITNNCYPVGAVLAVVLKNLANGQLGAYTKRSFTKTTVS